MAAIYGWLEIPVAPVTEMWLIHGGEDSGGDAAVDYHHFDGVTVTDLNPSNYMFPGLANYGAGIRSMAVSAGGVLVGLHDAGEHRLYAYSSEFGGSFVSLYERYLDSDVLDCEEGNVLMLSNEKMVGPAKASGVPIYDLESVSSSLNHYTDTKGAYNLTHSGQYFCWHNNYVISIDWDGNSFDAWNWNGTTLTKIDEIASPYPFWTHYLHTSGRCKSDGSYIYFSGSDSGLQLADVRGIKVCTFDGISLTEVLGINQVPVWPLNAEGGCLDIAVGGGYIFVLFFEAAASYARTLYSYTFNGATFTQIDSLTLTGTTSNNLSLESGNMWLVVDGNGIWDVANGLFSTQLHSGSFISTHTGQAARSSLLLTSALAAYDSISEHSTMKAQDNVPRWWFDFQDQDHTIPLNTYGSDINAKKLTAPIPTNIVEILPTRIGMIRAISINGTHLVDSGTAFPLGGEFNNQDEFAMMFTIGCQGPVTQMAAYHCSDASDFTWRSYFAGNDFVIEFKNVDGNIIVFTKVGWADGLLHSVGIRQYSTAPIGIWINFDGASPEQKVFSGSTRLNAVTKSFMLGDSAVWAPEVTNGVFSDLLQYWNSKTGFNSAYTTKVQSEIL